ncbi:MAG: MBG domain-containing protein [Methylovulum sp.]|nr:MBG domain-containing protein [Methylovulum sp.]
MKSNRQQPKLDNLFFGTQKPLRRALNLAILAIIYSPSLLANPDGANVISGQASIETSPGVTQITNSPNAVIQWQNFNIAQNEITRFIQQNSQSAVLNRIIGENPSAILGQLASNGKVFLINPNGIVFGANSVIDTQGLVASSLNLSDRDFLNGNYHFIAGSTSGNIVNEGIIRAGKDGNIILIAPSITNNGIIKTAGGQITLAAGQELVLTNLDDPDIRFEIQAPDNAVLNLGKLLNEGGAVNVFANSITHSGEVNADSVALDAQGNIKLVARQDINLTADSKLSANNRYGDAGIISVESKTGTTLANGTIEAKATEAGKGGNITVLGEQVGLLDKASIDASGANGGGQVLVGGDKQGKNPDIHNAKATYIGADTQINADAKTDGNGGKVIAWSDNATRAYGQISAKGGKQRGDGGFVETSAHWLDTSGIKVEASAAHGKSGEWLLDPNNIRIQEIGSDKDIDGDPNWTTTADFAILTTGSIQTALNNGTSVSVTTGTTEPNRQDGNITVASSISKTRGGDAGLSLIAHNTITIDAPIVSSVGKLDLTLTPDSDAKDGGFAKINDAIDLNSGMLTLKGGRTQQLLGKLENVGAVNIEENATIILNRSFVTDTVNIAQGATLTSNRGLVTDTVTTNTLNLDGGTLTGSGAVTVNSEFNFKSGTLGGTGLFTTAKDSTTALADIGPVNLDRRWDNLGTINWQQGAGVIGSPLGSNSKLNNGGGFNIGSNDEDKSVIREINITQFNNLGTLDLSGGILKIHSNGSDSGSYNVTGTGQLQFWDGTREFISGAAITSKTEVVVFQNSANQFKHDASYEAKATQINNSVVAFGTGNPIVLQTLTVTDNSDVAFGAGNAIDLSTLNIDNSQVRFTTGNLVKLSELLINRDGTLSGTDDVKISKTFSFSSGTLSLTNSELGFSKKLTTDKNSTTTLAKNVNVDTDWDNRGTVNFNITSPSGTPTVVTSWNNYGHIKWNGPVGTKDLGNTIILTNRPGGVFDIKDQLGGVQDGVRDINTKEFNNQGTMNLSSGILRIASPGTDTGTYKVTGTGQLEFKDNERNFVGAKIGTKIDSAHSVRFSGKAYSFDKDAEYNLQETVIDTGAKVTFNMPATSVNLKMSGVGSELSNADSLTVSGQFDWSGGKLSGKDFTFKNFNYTAGTMNAKGSVIINDESGSLLSLPAMPLISRLDASTSGGLKLNGGIRATGNETAITLTSVGGFDNGIGAKLITPNGRWLVYSDAPDNKLGGLTANFKHYGCSVVEGCNDSFVLPDGDGLLYSVVPELIPAIPTDVNKTSTYGNAVTFTPTYSGFIDGDSDVTVGIKGNVIYSLDGTNAGDHKVAYDVSNLSNGLGYKFSSTTNDVWTITRRDLNITAVTLSKVYGDPDPKKLAYSAPELIEGDTLSGKLGRNTGEDVDSYAIDINNSNLNNPNYNINYYTEAGSLLEITPRDLFIAAVPSSKVYGEPDPEKFTYSANGLINEDTLNGTLIRIKGEDARHYPIDNTKSFSGNSNYTINYSPLADGLLTIDPRPLNITAIPSSKFYGDPDPAKFDYIPPELVEGDVLNGALIRINGEDVGHYPIDNTKSFLGNPNYTITYDTLADGLLAIIKSEEPSTPPEPVVQEEIKDQQNQVQVVTMAEFSAQEVEVDGSEESEPETTGSKQLKPGQAAEPKATKQKPLKQCK